MILSDIAYNDFKAQALTRGVKYKTGPFAVRLKTNVENLIQRVYRFYSAAPLLGDDQFCHYHIEIQKAGLIKPRAVFLIDGVRPFEDYPLAHAFALYEWGLNWCIGTTANQYLLLHSAAVERNGFAVILPAMPGSGKSTLCSGLINRGWRLLSDEFGVIDHSSCSVVPLPRSIPLKNESINVLKHYAPQATMGSLMKNTRKGDVCHMAPPVSSILSQTEYATPAWVIFPRFVKGSELVVEPQHDSVAFTRLSNNAFNYQVTMEKGFASLISLVRQSDCFGMQFGDMDLAVDYLNGLAEEKARESAG